MSPATDSKGGRRTDHTPLETGASEQPTPAPSNLGYYIFLQVFVLSSGTHSTLWLTSGNWTLIKRLCCAQSLPTVSFTLHRRGSNKQTRTRKQANKPTNNNNQSRSRNWLEKKDNGDPPFYRPPSAFFTRKFQ